MRLSSRLFGLIALTISPFVLAKEVEVEIIKKEYSPSVITIDVGDTVIWRNNEKRQYHNVWFKALGEDEPEYFFPGESYQRTFDKAGEFPYECGPHPMMKGTVIVK